MIRLVASITLALSLPAQTRDEVLAAMRRATTFYQARVATEGGYHFHYLPDLTGGKSEHASGPTQIENQRDATPRVALAYLESYDATHDRIYLEAARAAALALVRGQLCSGGWDYLTEFDPAKRRRYPYRADNNCALTKPPTTLDDNVTQACIRVLMRVDRELDFSDPKIHEAAQFALSALVRAQYPNGAWPQRFNQSVPGEAPAAARASYPASWPRQWPGGNYQQHYTLNDHALADVIDTLLEAARLYRDPRYRQAAERGGAFLLAAQMPDPQPGWAQQYDANLHPIWARVFEPPAVSGLETQSAIRILMTLYRETGDRRYLEPVPRALAWLERSVFLRHGEPTLARFYELETNRPLYITAGRREHGRVVQGYQLSYSDESIITHYALRLSARGLRDLRRDFEQVQSQPRPDRLHGLSPWQDQRPPRAPATEKVRDLIASLDERGAWIGNGQIRSTIFAANLESLAAYAQTLEPKINYVVRGSGPLTLVLVHGWTCDHTLWNAQTEGLAKDARIVAIDLPGHGASESPGESALTMDNYARAIATVLKREGITRAVLAGHSMGTPVVRQFARLFPSQTQALILVDGTIYTRALAEQAQGRESRYRGDAGREIRRQVVDSYLTPYMSAAVREQIRRVMLAAPEATAVGAMRGMLNLAMWRDESAVQVPTLALYAQESRLSPEYLRRLFPRLEYHRLSRTGHFLMMEKPDEFNRLVRQFLAKLR